MKASVNQAPTPQWLLDLEKDRDNPGNEYLVIVCKRDPVNEKEAFTITSHSTQEGGKVLCETMIHNAIGMGKIDEMMRMAELLVRIGTNAIVNINLEVERRANEN